MIPHDEESNLSILSLKSLCRGKTVNCMKFGDIYIGKTRSVYPSNELFRCYFPVL